MAIRKATLEQDILTPADEIDELLGNIIAGKKADDDDDDLDEDEDDAPKKKGGKKSQR